MKEVLEATHLINTKDLISMMNLLVCKILKNRLLLFSKHETSLSTQISIKIDLEKPQKVFQENVKEVVFDLKHHKNLSFLVESKEWSPQK